MFLYANAILLASQEWYSEGTIMTETDVSKVTVKIYGQEYTFSSTQSKDDLIRIANHVDEVMRELAANGAQGSMSRISILAAINVTGELFAERAAQVEFAREKEQLEKDILHYQQLWEEAKRSHLQYKEDVKEIQEQKDSIQEKLNAKTIENDNLLRNANDREATIARLESEVAQATSKLRSASDQSEDNSELIRELKDKLKEIEGNYFELQMENIQLKGDLERFRNNL
jgi:cell division protein ZapA